MPRYKTLVSATIVGVAAITLAEAQGRSLMISPERGRALQASSSIGANAPDLGLTPPAVGTATRTADAPAAPRVAVRTIRASMAARPLVAVRSCDLNGDGKVDELDLALIRAALGTGKESADVTGDSIVDERDLGAVLAAWTR